MNNVTSIKVSIYEINENININEPEVDPVPNDDQEDTSGFVMSM